jgi:sugar lactone lactonase YvrE
MTRRKTSLAAALVLSLLAAGAAQAQTCLNDGANPYRVDAGWLKPPPGRAWGSSSAVGISASGEIWAADRCAANSCATSDLAPVMKLDGAGNVTAAIGAGLFATPHSLTVDRDGNLWITDVGSAPGKGHQVVKLSPSGEVLMRLGRAGEAGPGTDQFDQPTGVAFAPNGDILVSEGHSPSYGNSRIVRFDRDGKFLSVIGQRGAGPMDFVGPHALAFDRRGRMYVADRGNARVSVFNRAGKLVAAWTHFGIPQALFIDGRDQLYVSDITSTRAANPGCLRGIRVANARTGKVTAFIPETLPEDALNGAEGLVVDANGSIYAAMVASRELRKWTRASR